MRIKKDFDLLETLIGSYVWERDLTIEGICRFERVLIVFSNTSFIKNASDMVGRHIFMIEHLKNGHFRIRFKENANLTTVIAADGYEYTFG